MARINLTNLETVCCIARVGTFSAAAQHLNASQPAITSRVRELEQSLGFAFFQRRGRQMELTIQGRQFIQMVEPLVAQIDEAVLTFASPNAAAGVVRIGVGMTTMTSWFPNVIQRLKQEMPNVRYEVEVDMGMNMLQKLEAGKLDIVVAAGKVRDPQFTTVDLHPAELRWVMSPRIPTARDGVPLSVGEIFNSAPLWLVLRPSILFPRSLEVIKAHGGSLQNINTCGSMSAIAELAERSVGIGMVATALVQDRLATGALVPVSDVLKPEYLEVTLACNKDQQQSIVHYVTECIIECDKEYYASQNWGDQS